jgi:hypothetical protein
MPAFPWRRRRPRPDDTGSMPLAMLVTLVGVTLSAGVSGMVIGQIKSSQRAADRVTAVSAAQAGLDFALKTIRSSVDNTGAGKLDALPCDWSKPAYAPPDSNYTVAVGYFISNPSSMVKSLAGIDLNDLNIKAGTATSVTSLLTALGKTAAQATTGLTTALSSAVGCVNGTLLQVPLYGLVQATGKSGTATRTLYATYKFHNIDDTIPGGRLVIGGTGGQYCIGATTAAPVVGDPVVAVPCALPDPQVSFIYPKNLSLALESSRTNAKGPYPYGLCITAVTPPVAGEAATFQECSPTKDASQQFDYEVNQQTYYGAENTVDANGLPTIASSGYCLSVGSAVVGTGSPMVMATGNNCGKAGVTGKSFVPDASVGAGGAGMNSGQYVNYGEVGRCLDLTNEDPGGGWASNGHKQLGLISYPCKQTFTGDVYWNHKWTGPLTEALITSGVTSAQGQIYTVQPSNPARNWCLVSPGPAGGYVWVAKCNAANSDQQWTVNGDTGRAADSYQVTDGTNCLEAAGDRGSQYIFSGTISYVITAPCDGSRVTQKWNAPAVILANPLQAIQEK